MSVSHLRVVPAAPRHARLVVLAKALKRFRPEIRDGVVQLARRHVRLAELAQSFPALLAALAWPRGEFDARPVIRGAIAGAPLTSLADAARVPLWLRKVPAQMIVAPLPVLPDSAFVRHRIVNHLPKNARQAHRWFAAVSSAARWADEEFALWQARECAADKPAPRRRRRGYRNPETAASCWSCGRGSAAGRERSVMR